MRRIASGDGRRDNRGPIPDAPARRAAAAARRRRPQRGKLRIYFGAAPASARPTPCSAPRSASARPGATCVVGVVETHGRSETAALLAGLERCRCARSPYRGRTLHEFDLDAALARKPAADPGRRAGAHQRARLAPPQALAGRRGAARRRHRRLDDTQRPAPRKPERRRRRHHRRPRARDRARHGVRRGRRGRAGRHRRPTSCSRA